MAIILIFTSAMLFYGLASRRIAESIFTGPLVFTVAGAAAALLLTNIGEAKSTADSLHFAEIGLVLLLFTDAARIDPARLRSTSILSARLLLVGLPLSLFFGTVMARWIVPGLTLLEAAILAAILVPTDAGLGEAILTDERIPKTIRETLSVEAGLNDGLAVPFLLFFIAAAAAPAGGASNSLHVYVLEQLGYGIALGVGVGISGGYALEMAARRKWMSESFGQVAIMALPILCLLFSEIISASMFIAAFVAGLSVQRGFPGAGRYSLAFSGLWGQVLNLAVFFLFGMAAVHFRKDFTLEALAYAIASLTVVRMVPVAIALIGTGTAIRTRIFIGWFGPRGLASIVLGLVFLEREVSLPGETTIRAAVVLTVMLSIVLHGLSAKPGTALLVSDKDAAAR